MSTNRNLLTSPKADIYFMAAENAVKATNGKDEYTITLMIDPKDDTEGFLSAVSEVNDAKVVTAQSYRGKSDKIKAILATGKVKVTANSQFKPTVYDAKGNVREDAPMFFADSTGTAQMVVEPWRGDKGGTINLVCIIIHNVESPEGETATGGDRESRLAALKAEVAKYTKG